MSTITIPVKFINTDMHWRYDSMDNQLYCMHDDLEVDYTEQWAYCSDCDNKDLSEQDITNMMIDRAESIIDMRADMEIAEQLEHKH